MPARRPRARGPARVTSTRFFQPSPTPSFALPVTPVCGKTIQLASKSARINRCLQWLRNDRATRTGQGWFRKGRGAGVAVCLVFRTNGAQPSPALASRTESMLILILRSGRHRIADLEFSGCLEYKFKSTRRTVCRTMRNLSLQEKERTKID